LGYWFVVLAFLAAFLTSLAAAVVVPTLMAHHSFAAAKFDITKPIN
jgi:hypothetical protein